MKLSGNSYSPRVLAWLCKNVIGHCSNLSILDLSQIYEERIEKEVTRSSLLFSKALQGRGLHELNLSDNMLGLRAIQALQGFLKENDSLKILNINNCEIGHIGMVVLARALKYDKAAATAEASKKQTYGMKKPISLWEFHASFNQIGDEAAADLAELFEQMDTLEKVDISNNGIKTGFRALLPALKKTARSLRELYIQGNRSINKGVRYLMELIEESPNLEVIDISDLNMKK